MRKQPERTAKTKHALQEAFWELYCEKPIEKITVKKSLMQLGFTAVLFMNILRMYMPSEI